MVNLKCNTQWIETTIDLIFFVDNEKLVEILIQNGAQIDISDNIGNTPLHSASSFGYEKMVDLLISKGANISAENNLGYTPLHAAVAEKIGNFIYWNHLKCLNSNEFQFTILEYEKVVDLLIRKGSDVNVKNQDGKTALHIASARGSKKLCDYINPY